MMTQPIRTFKDLTSETAPAGGNDFTKLDQSHEDRRLLEQHARYARAELLANALGDAALWLGRQWHRLVAGIKADFRLRAAEAQLFRMSDRELADIGLCRGDITFAIREVAHGAAPEIEGEMRPVTAANQNMRRAA
jgi:uncharacterized protein YjiS (DUF1127 family)